MTDGAHAASMLTLDRLICDIHPLIAGTEEAARKLQKKPQGQGHLSVRWLTHPNIDFDDWPVDKVGKEDDYEPGEGAPTHDAARCQSATDAHSSNLPPTCTES